MKSMVVVIPIMGRLNDLKPFWGLLLNNTLHADLFIVSNTPPDVREQEQEELFFAKYIKPHWQGDVHYYPQADNIGVIEAMQLGYEKTDHEIVAYLHNDLYIYEEGWDTDVIYQFETLDQPGLIGFFGGEGIHSNSGRNDVWSNMLEAEIHGGRFGAYGEAKEVAVLDGMAMIASREMLDVRDGLDTDFKIHHFYDLDLSLESLDRGYKNYIIPIAIHHHSGQTANYPDFNRWANRYMDMDDQPNDGQNAIYLANRMRWVRKWVDKLPYHVSQGKFGG